MLYPLLFLHFILHAQDQRSFFLNSQGRALGFPTDLSAQHSNSLQLRSQLPYGIADYARLNFSLCLASSNLKSRWTLGLQQTALRPVYNLQAQSALKLSPIWTIGIACELRKPAIENYKIGLSMQVEQLISIGENSQLTAQLSALKYDRDKVQSELKLVYNLQLQSSYFLHLQSDVSAHGVDILIAASTGEKHSYLLGFSAMRQAIHLAYRLKAEHWLCSIGLSSHPFLAYSPESLLVYAP